MKVKALPASDGEHEALVRVAIDTPVLVSPMVPISLPAIPELLQRPPRDALARLLNRVFATALADGELDFLHGRVLCVVLSDSSLHFNLTLQDEALAMTPATAHWDLRISGRPYDFMMLAARSVDADTLFFQRRLKIEGDTELGLSLKNFLDAQDLSGLPFAGLINTALQKAIDLNDWLLPVRRLPPQ